MTGKNREYDTSTNEAIRNANIAYAAVIVAVAAVAMIGLAIKAGMNSDPSERLIEISETQDGEQLDPFSLTTDN